MPVLQFKGKTAVECYHHTVPHHVLDFDPKLSILSKGEKPGLDGNLIIEGDNLVALKALLPTHAGRIKCIYIDPPYNTGNEGWVYNDNLTQPQFKEWLGQTVGKEGEDATRHDKWCCMMYPRLQLLKELLRDDGAIFISIDDNEVQHLRMLLDEIFGESNFVATIIWQKVYSPKSSAKFFSENHDYIVAYARNRAEWDRHLLPRTEEQDDRYDNPDNDTRGPWKPSGLDARNPYSKGRYSITCPSGRIIAGPPPKENEKAKLDICEKITAERVRRVIKGYTAHKRSGSDSTQGNRVTGLGGSFTYSRVGAPLFGEYRDLGPKLPPYEELAKYIFYTETSRDFDRGAIDETSGKIGEDGGTSYYLLYTPDGKKDRALDLEWLVSLDKTEKNRRIVVYCEKI